MLKEPRYSEKLSKAEAIQELTLQASIICQSITFRDFLDLDICGYQYIVDEAVEELGLDEELIHKLLEDYVIQILNSMKQFREHLNGLINSASENKELDYSTLRELAHKNLGVARNLRIKDAEKLLYVLMKKDDLQYLQACLKALEACAIKLKPTCAYNAINLIKVKSSL